MGMEDDLLWGIVTEPDTGAGAFQNLIRRTLKKGDSME